MISYNRVVIMGGLTRDPDIRTVGNQGMKVARLNVCINEKRKAQDGKIVDIPTFIDVEAWGSMAELSEKYLAKSSNVFVEGKLQLEQWERDGVKHQKIKIRAANLKFIPKGNVPVQKGRTGGYGPKSPVTENPTAECEDGPIFIDAEEDATATDI